MRTGRFKIRKFIKGATVSAVVVVAIWGCSKFGNNTNKVADVIKQTLPFINPPLKGIDVAYTDFLVDADKGAELQYPSGSKISIPANAFCDDNGNDIKGNVNIKYREFHDPIDFYVSGIPMTYDSGSQHYTFESAGMLDIRGEQNCKPVHIKKDKSIGVRMPSKQKSGNFNMYALDTTKKAWVYLGKKEVVPMDELKREKKTAVTEKPKGNLPQIEADIANIEDKVPVKPGIENKKKYRFNILADPNDFPEVSMYQNYIFEVEDTCKAYDDRYSKITWDNAELKRIKRTNAYFITVTRGNEHHTFSVHPVFDEASYPIAIKEYNKVYAEYSKALTKKKDEEAKELLRQKQEEEKRIAEQARREKEEQEAMAKADAERKIQEEKAEKEMMANLNQTVETNNTQGLTSYFFNVKRFGTINCDSPYAYPQGAVVQVDCKSDKGTIPANQQVYFVAKSRNILYTYGSQGTFRYDPEDVNLAWCATQNNELAIFTNDDFKKIPGQQGTQTLTFHVVSDKLKNVDDVKALLKQYM